MVANLFGQLLAKQGRLRCQSRIGQIARDIAKCVKQQRVKTKQINDLKRAASNEVRQQHATFLQSGSIFAMAKEKGGEAISGLFNADGSLNFENASKDQAAYTELQKFQQQYTLMAQNQMQKQLEEIESQAEAAMETEVESLKDYQADLEMEKTTLEAELEVYKATEEQEKKFHQENIKGMFA